MPGDAQVRWIAARFNLDLRSRVAIMGVINVTPDSFSDGGRFFDRGRAVEHGLELMKAGADIIDVGGESTRPGARPVTAAEEIGRVAPVIERLAEQGALVSVDTYKAEVAAEALDAGAAIVNDVSALSIDPEMAPLVAGRGAGVVLMHMRGNPRNMQINPAYDDVVAEVRDELGKAVSRGLAAGIEAAAMVVDPGIGFGKTVEHNLSLIKHLDRLIELGRPVMIGTSRKSFIGRITGAEVDDRLIGTAASTAAAILRGASIVRVHDVAELRQAVQIAEAIRGAP